MHEGRIVNQPWSYLDFNFGLRGIVASSASVRVTSIPKTALCNLQALQKSRQSQLIYNFFVYVLFVQALVFSPVPYG